MTTTTKPRCTVPGSPTCVLPPIARDTTQPHSATHSHTCDVCGRVWRVETNRRKQKFWRWDGHTINKKAVTR